MTNSKNTKRALISSVLAMLVCVAMLVSSTFAWFTDSVSTGKNSIVAGNLDVDLVDAEGNSLEDKVLNFVKAEGADGEEILWEPGCTYNLPEVSVKNNGNLALKYRIVVNGVEGDEKLLEAIEFTAKLGGEAVKLDDYVGHLEAGETSAQPLVISGHMKEAAGNEYKGLTAEGISITVIATQDTVESDSFNNQYDAGATLDFVPVTTSEELTEAIANNKNVVLNNDIQLPEQLVISHDVTISGNDTTITAPVGGTRIIDAAGNEEKVTITLTDLNLVADDAERCISFYDNKGGIDLILDQCTATANKYAINVASNNPNANITVKNSEITGWCAFQTWSEGTKATFENCTLIGNNTFGYNAEGWNDFSTIVINDSAANADLTFNNCRFEANQTTGNKQYLLSVRTSGAKVTVNNCTFFADENEIPNNDLGKYITIYPEAIDLQLTINGELIPIA